MQETTGIEYLLDYDGEEYTGDDGLTMRFEIKRCPVSHERPLGVKYSFFAAIDKVRTERKKD